MIVLLHGSYSSLDGWDKMAKGLATDHRVIRFDMPGMGLSETIPVDQPTSAAFGDDILNELLAKLNISGPLTLVGTSSGGAVAFHFAARFPERVTTLVMANTPADPVFNEKVPRSDELDVEIKKAAASGFKSLRYWTVYLPWLSADPKRVSTAWIQRYYDMNRRATPVKNHYFWRSTADAAATQATIAKVKAPTLLVWGTHDYVLPLAAMGVLEGYLKQASVSTIVLSDVGHYPPFEVPERFTTLTRAFEDAVTRPVAAK